MTFAGKIPARGPHCAPSQSPGCTRAVGCSGLLQLIVSLVLACNSQPMGSVMTPPSTPPATPAVEIAGATEHATAEAVVWASARAFVVGSAGAIEATPPRANPILIDGARYHGWLGAFDAQGAAAWTRRLDGKREIHVRAAAALGNDLVICGEQRAGDAREYTGFVARIASDGSERWRRDSLGTAGVTGLQAIAVRDGRGVVAGGMRRGKAWLTAFDGEGAPGWTVELAGLDEVTAMMPAGDGVVVAGVTGRSTTSAGTSRLYAIDAGGATRWTTALPEGGPGELFAIAALGDGGIAVGQAPDAGGRDGAWLVRFGAGGAIQSSQVLAGNDVAAARAVAATSDGGLVVAGSSFEAPRGRRASVWRFDAAGQLAWQRAYGDGESFARGVAATPDGGAVVVGATQPAGATLRPWIVAIDPRGALRWTAP